MNARQIRWISLGAILFLGACATLPPSGPSVMVLPGNGKNFDQFRFDDYECRNFASTQLGGATAEGSQVDSGVKSAAIGTAVGAAAGAIIGGQRGAAAGAGTGLIVGAASGAGASQSSAMSLQRRYDISYQQCMYAKGHQIPTSGRFDGQRRSYGPPAAGAPPPPPPGSPPPAPR